RNLYFDGHPCGNSILGSNESIDGLTAKQMRDYFLKRYSPNNMVLACAGNFDWSQICSVVEADCGKWQKQDVGRELEDFSGSKKNERIEKANLAREHICLMSPCVSAQDPRRFAASLLGVIIGDDVGSRFFWELVDKALAEAAAMQFGAMDGTGVFHSYIRCSSENVTKVLDTIKGIFASLSKNGIGEEELQKAKNKTLSALVLKNELPMGRLLDLGFNWTYLEEYRTIEDDINSIKAVTVDEVCSLIEQFDLGEFTQLSIGPAQDSS
ncbi:MAG: insulinase family protein, partial [Phycisphaerae bacterium]|nr:insulinase family protein [Phycisphaerae bacterium]